MLPWVYTEYLMVERQKELQEYIKQRSLINQLGKASNTSGLVGFIRAARSILRTPLVFFRNLRMAPRKQALLSDKGYEVEQSRDEMDHFCSCERVNLHTL